MKINLKFGRKSADADASGGDVKSSAKASKRKSKNDGGGHQDPLCESHRKGALGDCLPLGRISRVRRVSRSQ